MATKKTPTVKTPAEKTNSQKHYADVVLTSLPDRELEIVGEITAEKMSVMREKALAKFRESLELPGFRKGNAPEALVAQKVGEIRLLEEAAEIALSEEYPNILSDHNIDAIGRPEIVITKIAPGNPLGFKIKTSLVPNITLGNYSKIAKESREMENKKSTTSEVTDKEIDDVLLNIRQNMAHQKMHADLGLPEHSHAHGDVAESDLPEVNDEFAKMIGGFTDVADLKTKIKANILVEKGLKEKDKKRTAVLEAIMDASTIEIPKIIVEGEMEKMLAQFKDDIGKAGVKYEEYLAHIKKTEDDIKKEWHDTAVKRAKSQIILNTIGREEGIAPEEDEVKKEMENILIHHKEADRFRVRMYVETFMTNELVFQFLENQK